jgi:hypothetical protein
MSMDCGWIQATAMRTRGVAVTTMKRPASHLKIVRRPASHSYGIAVIPSRLQPKKDIATPSLEVAGYRGTAYNRLAKRKSRSRGLLRIGFPMNDACRMKVSKKIPTDKRMKYTYRIVHGVHTLGCAGAACSVCLASEARFCWCGATLAKNCDTKKLTNFHTFVLSSRNPVQDFDDPQDQKEMQDIMKSTLTLALENRKYAAYCRFLYMAAMTNCPSTMTAIGKTIVTCSYARVVELVKQRADEAIPTYRGGQFAGALTVKELGGGLIEFMDTLAPDVIIHMKKWDCASNDEEVTHALRSIIQRIDQAVSAKPAEVYGFGLYKGKRFCELLVLGGMAGVLEMRCGPGILDACADIWPLPVNSKEMLQLIFPTAVEFGLVREGIVALKRSLRTSGKYSLPLLVAQLCFWGQQDAGLLDWL